MDNIVEYLLCLIINRLTPSSTIKRDSISLLLITALKVLKLLSMIVILITHFHITPVVAFPSETIR